MEFYSNNESQHKKKGIDWDLYSAYEYNADEFLFEFDEITSVLAVYEGQNEEEDWRWIIKTTDNSIWYVKAWCAFSGWDCESNVEICQKFTDIDEIDDDKEVIANLRDQMNKSKTKTWRETMDNEMLNNNE